MKDVKAFAYVSLYIFLRLTPILWLILNQLTDPVVLTSNIQTVYSV